MALKNKGVLVLTAVLIIVAAFLVPKLTVMPLWHDEAFSGLLPQYDFGEMIYRIGLDVHPPLYYILLKSWTLLFQNTLFSIRLFSLFFGLLTVLAAYFFVKKAFQNKKLALFSSTLLALSSFQIQYNMEARMYTLGAFLVLLSSVFLLKALEEKKWNWWIFYSLTAACAIYTHYYVFFWIFAQGIYIIYWIVKNSEFKSIRFPLGSVFLIILLYLPWLKTFLQQLNQVQETYWIPKMTVWSLPNTFLSMTVGGSTDAERYWYLLAILMIFVLGAFIRFLKKTQNAAKWLVFFLIVIPFLLSIFLSIKTSIYLDRYFIFALPFYLIVLAGAVLSIGGKTAGKIIVALAILGMAASFPVRWTSFRISEKPGMTAAANNLNEEVGKNDKIFVGSSFVYFTFKYYNETGISPLLFAPGHLPHFSGTALLAEKDVISDFQAETKKGDIAWVINTTGFGNYQPATPENWQKLEEKGFEDTYDYRGWIVVSKYQVN